MSMTRNGRLLGAAIAVAMFLGLVCLAELVVAQRSESDRIEAEAIRREADAAKVAADALEAENAALDAAITALDAKITALETGKRPSRKRPR